ncbi:SDR family oxidoreductase [Nocardioides sp.]|uniref:SDR family oxidoreductase n=1 Tax=Nocardioides sp. TaxID=35761 RepID=UPI00260E0CD0|nr:SDR family oxidoreductase [Nocardioides sp.]
MTAPLVVPGLAGKVVVVAGVGDGLGHAVALRSAAAGASVVLAARTAARLDAVAEEIRALGGTALTVPTDLTDAAAVEALAATTLAELGRIDTVVFNAFVQPPHRPLLATDETEIRSGLDINLLAALSVVRACAPALVEHAGSVVMVNSMVLHNRLPNYGAYRMQKAGLLALARSLSIELGPQGVRVNSVAPGYIWADKVQAMVGRQAARRGVEPTVIYDEIAADADLRRLPEPDDIAATVLFLASDLARAITGQCLSVDCGHTHT